MDQPVKRRQRHRITRPELAAAIAFSGLLHMEIVDRAGLRSTEISEIVRGHVRTPPPETRRRLALVLGVEESVLFPDLTEPDHQPEELPVT